MGLKEPKTETKTETKKKEYKFVTKKNIIYISLIAIGIVTGILVFSAGGLSVWETPYGQYGLYDYYTKPPPPPPEKATGLVKFEVYDLFLGEQVSVNISLFWYVNESYYADVETNNVFLINEASLCTINDTNYYPITYEVVTSGKSSGDPYIMRLGGYRVANNTNITARIVGIDGLFNESYRFTSNITNGYHVVEFKLTNLEWDLYNTTWGLGAWIPQYLLPPKADYYNLSYTGLWMTVNGSISNAKFRHEGDLNNYPLNFLEIDIGETSEWGNTTVFHVPVLNDLTLIVSGYWRLGQNKGIRFNDYFIDNVTNRYVTVPNGTIGIP